MPLGAEALEASTSPAPAGGEGLGNRCRALGRLLAASLALVLVASGTIVLGVREVVDALPDLPEGVDLSAIDVLSEAVEREIAFPSTVVASDGSVIGRFKSSTTHLRVVPESLPRVAAAAILASEDDQFWEHRGFEPAAIARAVVANLRGGGIEQGGSTITQQVAKLLFTGDSPTVERKIAELRTAVELERHFTKEEILSAYLNSVYFGNGAFGIEAAANVYFRRPAAELSLSEAALLAGIIPAPSAYEPRSQPERAEQRRQHVLDRLEQLGWFTSEEIDAARATPPVVQPPRPSVERFPYYLDYVRRFLLDEMGLSAHEIYGAGLRIETTVVPGLQVAAREAVKRHLPDPTGPAAAVVVIDHSTGGVLALVGGRDFDASQVNLALGESGGGSGRPPGSAFKPFVLAEAIEQGYSLHDQLPAPETYIPTTVTDPEPVHNYSRRGYGHVSLDRATRHSINTAYVGLAETVGVSAVAQRAIAAGLERLPDPNEAGPSIAIGAYETSPLNLAAAYGAFATDGLRLHPSPILSVTPPAIAIDEVPMGPADRVMSWETARIVTTALRGVVESGTATNAAIGRPVAAKTGTSNDYADAWLVGYSPHLVAATWVGHPAGNVPMQDVNGVSRVTGGSIPASIWRDVMSAAHNGVEVTDFPPAPDRAPSTPSRTTTPPPPAPPAPTTPPPAPAPTTTRPAPTTTTTRPAPTTTTPTGPVPATTPADATTTTQPALTTTTSRPPPATTTTETAPTTTSSQPPPTTTTTSNAPSPTTTAAQPDSSTGNGRCKERKPADPSCRDAARRS